MNTLNPEILSKEFFKKFNIKNPIIQAPMAGGISTPELVSAVIQSHAIGFLAAGYLSAQVMEKQIKEVKSVTEGIFGVNLFLLESVKKARYVKPEIISKIEKKLNIFQSKSMTAEVNEENDHKIDIIIKNGVKIVSFTFGTPKKEWVKKLKNNNIYTIGSCTNILEAQSVQESGCDAVIVQGVEAGGHRGSFLNKNDEVGLFSLLQEVSQSVKIPIIATGGIANGKGILAVQVLGAMGVQIGTGFLLTKESGASGAYKAALLNAYSHETAITESISGKKARGKSNYFIEALHQNRKKIFPFPIQNSMTKEIKNYAKNQEDSEFMSLWCGQSVHLVKNILTVNEFINKIMGEYNDEVKRLSLLLRNS